MWYAYVLCVAAPDVCVRFLCLSVSWVIENSRWYGLFFFFFEFFSTYFFRIFPPAFSGDRKCQDFAGCVYVACIRAVSVCAGCSHALFVCVCVVSDWEFEVVWFILLIFFFEFFSAYFFLHFLATEYAKISPVVCMWHAYALWVCALVVRTRFLCVYVSWVIGNSRLYGLFYLFFFEIFFRIFFFVFSGDRRWQDFASGCYPVCSLCFPVRSFARPFALVLVCSLLSFVRSLARPKPNPTLTLIQPCISPIP